MAATYFRSDQAVIHVTVAGVNLDSESWDVMEAGDIKADSLAVFPGGMAPQVELGGLPKRGELTVSRLWSDILIAQFKALDAVAGFAAVTASYAVLKPNRETTSNPPITYRGVLLSVERPNYKSSTAEEALLKLTVGLHGQLA